jgi:hypothetical protein
MEKWQSTTQHNVLGLLLVTAVVLRCAEGIVWTLDNMDTADWQKVVINQYENWEAPQNVGFGLHTENGHPRAVAYTDSNVGRDNLGDLCSVEWYHSLPHQPPAFDFNCIATTDEITANKFNNGFYIGGLNQNGQTVALCHVFWWNSNGFAQNGYYQLCDSDYGACVNNCCEMFVLCS